MLVALAGVHIYEEGLLKELITSHRVLGPLDDPRSSVTLHSAFQCAGMPEIHQSGLSQPLRTDSKDCGMLPWPTARSPKVAR